MSERLMAAVFSEVRLIWCSLYDSSSIGPATPSWVSACLTVVEHSQQEGFRECRCQRHVKPPNLEEKSL
jgi:hypothetical protein